MTAGPTAAGLTDQARALYPCGCDGLPEELPGLRTLLRAGRGRRGRVGHDPQPARRHAQPGPAGRPRTPAPAALPPVRRQLLVGLLRLGDEQAAPLTGDE